MMKIRMKKAQAGLEFLTTYAWAFVVILIVIGALAYFGVTNPSRILPDRCNSGSEFSCDNYVLDDTNNKVQILMKNSLGDVVNVSSFVVSTEGGTLNCPNEDVLMLRQTPGNYWRPGSQRTLNATCDLALAGLVAGQKEKITFTINYNDLKSGPAYTRTVTGEIFSTVR